MGALLLAGLVGVGVCVAPAALGQGPASEGGAPSERPLSELLREARAQLDARRYREAEALYSEAHRRSDSAVTQLGLARCAAGLGRNAEAVTWFEGALGSSQQALGTDLRSDVEKELERALRQVARFQVTLDPPGSAMVVDDRPAVVSEHGELLLDPGPHVLEVFSSRHTPQRLELKAVAGERRQFGVTLQHERDAAPGIDREDVYVPSAVKEEPGPKRVWTWVMLGSATVFTGTSILFHQLAKAEARDIEEACPGGPMPPCTLEQIDRRINGSNIRAYDILTNVSIGLAVASAVTSIVLFFVEPGLHDDEASAASAPSERAWQLRPDGVRLKF
jgi:hypothetical protein